jgi:hypothetical protein
LLVVYMTRQTLASLIKYGLAIQHPSLHVPTACISVSLKGDCGWGLPKNGPKALGKWQHALSRLEDLKCMSLLQT